MKKRIYAAGSIWASKLFRLSLLAGLVLILLGYSAITALDKAGVRRVAQQTLFSMSGRLQRYENYMANEKSKSLIRLLDKANELSRCLAREQGDRSALLASYTHQQRQQRSAQALDWFWQVDEAYVRGKYALCRTLMRHLEDTGDGDPLKNYLPQESATKNGRFSPYHRYEEIYHALH